MNSIHTIVIHHSASSRETSISDIRSWHLAKGWDDIGYHFVVRWDGEVLIGRELPTTGAHAPPNEGRVGICVIGDNTTVDQGWTPEQVLSLKHLVGSLQVVWPRATVEGHREVMAPGHTVCPGVDVSNLFG